MDKHICKYCKTEIIKEYVVKYHSNDLLYKLKCNCINEFVGKESYDNVINK